MPGWQGPLGSAIAAPDEVDEDKSYRRSHAVNQIEAPVRWPGVADGFDAVGRLNPGPQWDEQHGDEERNRHADD